MLDKGFKFERIFKGPGFAETLYLGICNKRRIIRKASNLDAFPFSRTALIREIRLLQLLKEELKPFFPEFIHTNLENQPEDSNDIPDIIYYDMPYYSTEEGWVTLSDFLLEDTTCREIACRVLGEIIDTAFMYFQLDERKPETDYAENTMLGSIRESVAWAFSDADFNSLFSLKDLRISGKPVRNIPELEAYFQNSSQMRSLLIPCRDRFLHGDFFPENILYNVKSGRWILLDPVSVRGVHRGDFILDLNKMEDWLTGELPALRMGQFTVDIPGNSVDFAIHNHSGKMGNLHRLGLPEWYKERLKEPKYANLFSRETGWRHRWLFVKAFYALCMLPLASKKKAIARYILALKSMDEFIELVNRGF